MELIVTILGLVSGPGVMASKPLFIAPKLVDTPSFWPDTYNIKLSLKSPEASKTAEFC